jgi:hypothetical protein
MPLLPLEQPLECFQGFTWSQEFDFFSDTAETVPFDFTGWTVTLTVKDREGSTTIITPTFGSSDPTTGVIVASLSSTQTASMKLGVARYALYITDGSTPVDKEPLMRGPFTVKELV